MEGKLYVIATPIGNLSDITLRALETFKKLDVLLCEDTRVTRKLLSHYEIQIKDLRRFDQHTEISKIQPLINLLLEGKHVGIVSDAGTPGILDPGQSLIRSIVDYNNEHQSGIIIEPIPGVSAITTLLSVAPLHTPRIYFYGFLPTKKGRTKILKELFEQSKQVAVAVYESKHRIVKLMDELKALEKNLSVTLGKELTKIHETIMTGTPGELLEYFEADPKHSNGEFVVIIENTIQKYSENSLDN